MTACVLPKRDRIGKALAVDEPVAALEIDDVTCTAEGSPIEDSNDVFLPRSLDLPRTAVAGSMAAGAGRRRSFAALVDSRPPNCECVRKVFRYGGTIRSSGATPDSTRACARTRVAPRAL
jgi:hypothetical protein